MTDDKKIIRTILGPVDGGQLMLPGSVVAEVVDFSEPKSFDDAPAWLLGQIGWQDWNVPVVSFAVLSGLAESESASSKSRILVVKSLNASSSTPYLGILINGLPKLAKVDSDSLGEINQASEFPSVFRVVEFDGKQAIIPDLDAMAEIIQAAVLAAEG